MSFESDTDTVLSLNEITLGFDAQGGLDCETESGIFEPKSPLEAMERNSSESSLSDGSSQRSENNESSTFMRKTGSSAHGLASFLRTSKETGLLKEISKANPSPAVIEELSQRTAAISPTNRNQSSPANLAKFRQEKATSVSSPSSGANKKVPMLPPAAVRKAESTNHVQTSPGQPNSHSTSSSRTDESFCNGDSTSRSSHEGSPVNKPLANSDANSHHSNGKCESPKRPLLPPTNQKPLPPRPKPVGRSPSNSSSEDLRQEPVEPVGSSPVNRPVPKPRSISIDSTGVAQDDTDSTTSGRDHSGTESHLTTRGEPKVQELKYENDILKHQIMHLKDKRSELEQENQILREVIQTSGELSPANSPVITRRESLAVRGGATPPPPKPPPPSSRFQGSKSMSPAESNEPSKTGSGSPSLSRLNSFPGMARPVPQPRSLSKSSSSSSVSQLPAKGAQSPQSSKPSGIKESIAEEKECNEVQTPPPTTSQAKQTQMFYLPQKPIPAPRILTKSIATKPRSGQDSAAVTSMNKEDEKKPVRTQPDGIYRGGVAYKKVEIKSDESWIQSRKASGSDESDRSRENTPASSAVDEKSDVTQPPARAPVPYRSVPIVGSSTPSPAPLQTSAPLSTDKATVPYRSVPIVGSSTPSPAPLQSSTPLSAGKATVPYRSVPIVGSSTPSPAPLQSSAPLSTDKAIVPYRSVPIVDLSTPSPAPLQTSAPLSTGKATVPYRSVPIVNTSSPSLSQGSTPVSAGLAYVPPSVGLDRFNAPPPFKTRNISRATAHPVRRTETGDAKRGATPLARSNSDESLKSITLRRMDGGAVERPNGAVPPKKPPRPWKRRSTNIEDLGWNPSFRPVSMVAGRKSPPLPLVGHREEDFAASCTVPRGLQEEAKLAVSKQGKQKKSPKRIRKERINSEDPDKPMTPKKRGIFGKKKEKAKTELYLEAPPAEREESDEDSSSEDEKGGTIKFMPKLRHVSLRKGSSSLEEEAEPEYHQLFEYVFVVGLREDPKTKALSTEMTYTFPPASGLLLSGKDAALNSIPQFCFPDIEHWKRTTTYRSETFSFVLTDIEGSRRFGYCRRFLPSGSGPRLPECYCIVSPLGCFSVYEKILNHVEERRAVSSSAVFTFLKAIVANPFPRPGRSVEVRAFSVKGHGMETVVFDRPMDSRLEHVDFSLLFTTLSQRKIIQLFSSLLMERRVILCAHSLSLLSSCAHALLALLYPFEWQHVFIPVLPNSLIDFCCSPLPYIIGLHPASIKLLDDLDMEEALVVDLDRKKFVRKIGDETSILPSKLFQYLEHCLGSSVISSEYQKPASRRASNSRADEIVINTFMTFFVYLYGDYKHCMKTVNPATGELVFQKKDYVKRFSSKSIRRFLEAFHMTQMFESFIERRENPVMAQTTAQSLFEQRKISELRERCQEIEIFSSKSRFNRWKIKKGLTKKK